MSSRGSRNKLEDDSNSTPKAKLDIEGLGKEWEQNACIRAHLREEGAVLFPQDVSESVKTTCEDLVQAVILPLLTRMSLTEGAPQPLVNSLRDELWILYKSMKKQVDESVVVHDGWMVRKFLGFVKMKARVGKPSTVTRQQ